MPGRKHEVIVTIDERTGNATIEGVGFEDGSCSTDVGQVAQSLGRVTHDKKKPEYYRQTTKAKVKIGRGG